VAVKRRVWLIVGSIAAGLLLLLALSHLMPLNFMSVQPKPEQQPQKVYDYYIIFDEVSGVDLMYVPLIVSVGDEVITEENKRYTIIKVEENRAYARFVEDINLDEYKQKLKQ
jgi:hypothetical protein